MRPQRRRRPTLVRPTLEPCEAKVLLSTVRTLSTGEVMIYNDQTRDLFIVDSAQAAKFSGKRIQDAISEAQGLVKSGQAQHFDSTATARLQQTLASVQFHC